MRMIFKIFKDDVKQIFTSFFIVVIIVGISVIPALYAWLNIYSNWDPYANTAGLSIAYVTEDRGFTEEDGTENNIGKSIESDLRENDAVTWVFLDTEEEAVAGVEDGSCYAAIVAPADLTERTENFFKEDVEKPSLIFYQNQKKNPVAVKISDAVLTSVRTSLNKQLTGVIIEKVFSQVNSAASEIDSDGGIAGLTEDLSSLSKNIKDYEKTIDSMIAGNSILLSAADQGKKDSAALVTEIDETSAALDDTSEQISSTEVTIDVYMDNVKKVISDSRNRLSSISSTLRNAKLTGDLKEMNNAVALAESDCDKLLYNINSLYRAISGTYIGNSVTELLPAKNELEAAVSSVDPANSITGAAALSLKRFYDTIGQVGTSLRRINTSAAGDIAVEKLESLERNTANEIDIILMTLSDSQDYFETALMPDLDGCLESLKTIVLSISGLMKNMSSTMAGMGNVFDALTVSLTSAGDSLSKTSGVLEMISERLDTAVIRLRDAEDSDELDIVMTTLSGDPDRYSEFFSEPVHMATEVIYPVENYGSAVTPFYTTLSIWVGALVLAAILKTKVKSGKYPEATPVQLFFGRYLLYLILAEVQTTVTVLGDLYIFGVQCLNPFLFWFAGAFTAMVFSLLIYSLVLAFGDVGKAIAVVCVVIQIAGSSGTYPIELLPAFFQRVYIFFPFPYAINAMREAIGGLYDGAYVIYLLQLSIFIGVSLVIGLLIRKPFLRFNKFMAHRMEDTKLL